MITAYIPYVILLLISPITGMYSLRFVYPDIKTYLKHRRLVLFIIFGLVAYVPTVIVSLSEMLVPLYSPLGSDPILFESEGSTILTFVLFLVVLIINTSLVEFFMVRRRETRVVGIPKHVIKYGIKQEIVRNKKKRREREISKITKDLENVVKDETDIKPLLEKIRMSVIRERKKEEKREERRKPEETTAKEVRLERIESGKETRSPEEIEKERRELLMELEAKLKETTTEDTDKRQKSEELLRRLKEKISEREPEKSVEDYKKEDVMEIARAIREMKSGGGEGRGETKPKHVRPEHEEPEREIERSLVSHARGHRRRGGEDILKEVVGDVRQQLIEPKRTGGEKEADEGEEVRWYQKTPKPEGSKMPQTEEGIEISEADLSFGGEMGEEFGDFSELGGLDEEFGELSDLEDLDQGLDSGDFDGMFVDVGGTTGGCPNCGKKGTIIVYCPSCGKPLCSNCAASVEGSEDYIKYKCPHCQEEFAMKRRMPA